MWHIRKYEAKRSKPLSPSFLCLIGSGFIPFTGFLLTSTERPSVQGKETCEGSVAVNAQITCASAECGMSGVSPTLVRDSSSAELPNALRC